MAAKRYISIRLTKSDEFLCFSSSTQNLYFHLILEADDNGFIDNINSILEVLKASHMDLKVLLEKDYLISFGENVFVIKHWPAQNKVPPAIIKTTKYTKELSTLDIDSRKFYIRNAEIEET